MQTPQFTSISPDSIREHAAAEAFIVLAMWLIFANNAKARLKNQWQNVETGCFEGVQSICSCHHCLTQPVKVAVASKAPLEQRHAVCATLSTAVCLFSGFFNILQLPRRRCKFV